MEAKIRPYVGREVSAPNPGKDDVNKAMIRHWAEVMGDQNPLYTDEAVAATSSKGGIIAPPTMLQIWAMEGYAMCQTPETDVQRELHHVFDAHGFTGALGTSTRAEYYRDLRPGDRIVSHTLIDNISERKNTARGVGYFIETVTRFTDQSGAEVGRQVFRVLKFQPNVATAQAAAAKADDATPVPVRDQPQRGHDTRRFASVAVGEKLPPLTIPVTAGLIIGGAIVSRDFTPVHHDKKAAQAAGLPDVFMNIITSNGLMGRYVTDWAGPECTLKAMDAKLGAPNLPGFVMTIAGQVKAKDEAAGTVDIAITGDNVWGTHMSGSVRVALPMEA